MITKILFLLLSIFLVGCNNQEEIPTEVKIVEEESQPVKSELSKIKINGDEFTFPLTVQDIKDKGYNIVYNQVIKNDNTIIYTTQLSRLDFVREDKTITAYFKGEYQAPIETGDVKSIVVNKNDKTSLTLPHGITYGDSVEKVEEKLKNVEDINILNLSETMIDIEEKGLTTRMYFDEGLYKIEFNSKVEDE